MGSGWAELDLGLCIGVEARANCALLGADDGLALSGCLNCILVLRAGFDRAEEEARPPRGIDGVLICIDVEDWH